MIKPCIEATMLRTKKRRICELLTARITHYLLAKPGTPTMFCQNISPEHYKKVTFEDQYLGNLKADVYLLASECILGVDILGEYDGHYHIDPTHHFHNLHSDGSEASFQRICRSDAYKRLEYLRPNGAIAFFIAGNDNDRDDLVKFANEIVTHIEAAAPKVLQEANHADRRAMVLSEAWIAEILFDKPGELIAQANMELLRRGQEHLKVVGYNPVKEQLHMSCNLHPDNTWMPHINNFTSNNGYGCKTCKGELARSRRKLRPDELIERCKAIGIEPLFNSEQYTNNRQILLWKCTKGQHLIKDNWAHIEDRGCSECRKSETASARQGSKFAAIEAKIKTRGDTMLSSKHDYINQVSPLKFKCQQCGEVAIQDGLHINRGQKHNCGQMTSARKARYIQGAETATLQAKELGIEIEGGIKTWRGRTTQLTCRVPELPYSITLRGSTINQRHSAKQHRNRRAQK